MKNGTSTTGRESSFYCSAEWHLYQMKSGLACPLYTWGFKLSKNTRVFSASAENVAEYFNVNRKTAHYALEELAESGFFVIDRIERGKPNTYKVIDHDEWAKLNIGRCVGKVSFPWEGQGDPLGRELYAISGGRVKFWPRQMTGLRNLGLSDEQIIKEFRTFIDRASYTGKRWKHAYYDFHAYLKGLVVTKTSSTVSSRTDTLPIQSNGYPRVQPNGHRVSSGTDPSSRSSSRKEVDEPESTIPARRRAGEYPSFKNKEKEENPTADLDANQKKNTKASPITTPAAALPIAAMRKKLGGSGDLARVMSEAEFEARRQLLQAQARQLKESAAG